MAYDAIFGPPNPGPHSVRVDGGTVSFASMPGGRDYHEDRFTAPGSSDHYPDDLPGCLMAVFDGHGGSQASETANFVVTDAFADEMVGLGHRHGYRTKLAKTVARLVTVTAGYDCGSTAAIVYIPANRLKAYVAILGDSRVVIGRGKTVEFVSPEHNVGRNLIERRAAQDREAVLGQIGRSHYIGVPYAERYLQLSRALGDRHLDMVLNREPEVFAVPLAKNSFVLLGTDGLFETQLQHDQSDEDALLGQMARRIHRGSNAHDLVQDAFWVQHSTDNITAVLWRA